MYTHENGHTYACRANDAIVFFPLGRLAKRLSYNCKFIIVYNPVVDNNLKAVKRFHPYLF